ncbi:MAG: hypothetical protein ACREHD_32085, partial [Pirellulales bacterium]
NWGDRQILSLLCTNVNSTRLALFVQRSRLAQNRPAFSGFSARRADGEHVVPAVRLLPRLPLERGGRSRQTRRARARPTRGRGGGVPI